MQKLKGDHIGCSNCMDNFSNQNILLACQASTMDLLEHTVKAKSVGELHIEYGKLDNKEVTVLRDSGCSIIGVRENLVREDQKIKGYFTLKLIDGQTQKYPLAWVNIDTPYLKGAYIAARFKDPIADVIIGNVDEARQVRYANAVTRSMTGLKVPVTESTDNCSLNFSKDLSKDFKQDQTDDSTLQNLWEKARLGTVDENKSGLISFEVKEGLLYKQFCKKCNPSVKEHQLVVPKNRRHLVLQKAHSSPLAGHMSTNRTRYRVYSNFFWPGVDKDIKEYVKTCEICQKARHPGKGGKSELGNMNIITTPFAKVAIDIIGPLEMSDRKNRYILTLVDMATRWPEAIPLPNITTPVVIEALSNIFTRIGFPEQILSDNGPQFKSELYQQVCRFFKIKIIKSTPYHPISNGLVERFNGTLKNMLRKAAETEPKNWDRFINATLFAYREVPNESTNISPYEMVYGRKVRGPMSILKHLFTNQFMEQETKNVYEYVLDLKDRLTFACQTAQRNDGQSKARYKKHYDKSSINKKVEEGDYVLILKPHRLNKLALHWDGPYVVEKKINKLNFKIRKGKQLKIYHINRLIKFHDRTAHHATPMEENSELLPACIASLITDREESKCLDDEITELPTLDLDCNNNHEEIKINPDLSKSQKEQVHHIIKKFHHIITDLPGRANVKEFKIQLSTEKPVNLKPYSVPIHMRETLNKEIENMLKMDIIEPSDSPYASPVVMVRKKDNTIRTCVDYRKLNAITRFDAETIPDQEDLFTQLNKATFFTKIDLTKGFWQVPIHKDSRQYTAFKVPNGHFQFKYVPFGLINSPSFFNRTIRNVLKGLENVVFYFDDICVFGYGWESHLASLEKVLNRLEEYGFTVKPSKLEVAFSNINFLGHIVGGGKLHPDPNNIQKVLSITTPTTKKEVRCLLGLANYYSKFIPSFASLVFPLTELLKKGMPTRVTWTPDCDKALGGIQDYLTQGPILKLPDPDIPFILQTDASDKGISCCLMQEVDGVLHPVKFLSRKLLPREQRYSVIERECLAIVWSVQRLSRYLCGTHFTIQCDHRPLSFLKSATYGNDRVCRWALLLQNYNFNIEHLKGNLNVVADTLSRLTK